MYSTDNGATWNEMIYYNPEGIELPVNPQTPGSIINGATTYMSWSTLTFSIPPVAQSPNTMLRWEQFYSSGTCCDNWGIDNISVEESIPGVNYLWSTGDTTLPLTVSSNVDTSYVISMLDGSMNVICTDTVTLNIDDNGFDNGVQVITNNFLGGQTTNLVIDAYNDGCPPQNGEVVVKLDPLMTFVNSSPSPSVITSDSLIYNYANLYKDSPHFIIEMSVSTDAAANPADSILLDALIYPVTGDINPWNNEKNYVFNVATGFGTEIKRVYPRGDCDVGYIENSQLMTYTVRFQNDFTSTVTDIRVRDMIDSNLDPTTLRVVAASDDIHLNWVSPSIVDFYFDSILLPTQSQNAVESTGYVVFEIEQVQGLNHGDLFSNEGQIDFLGTATEFTNVVTNTVSDGSHAPIGDTLEINAASAYNWNGQLIASSGLYVQLIPLPDGCDSTAILLLTLDSDVGLNTLSNNPFVIYPNPAKDHLVIEGNKVGVLRLINSAGRVVLEHDVSGNSIVQWMDLAAGIYIVEIESDNKLYREKVVIEE